MEHLSEEFWTERYLNCQTGWDLGEVSPPLKSYFDQLEDKTIKILIPGCGNAYEAEYLHVNGFSNVHVIDLSQEPLDTFLERVPSFPKAQVHKGDFFEHSGAYDLIVEQTMFCAINPPLRAKYAKQAAALLTPNGKLIGVLFNTQFEGGPPYGGSVDEYMGYFEPYFSQIHMEECFNSVGPRMNREAFIILRK